MSTKQKIEKEVVDYFKMFQKPLLIDYAKECALENKHSSSVIKFPYIFQSLDFTIGDIVDFAVFDIAQMKFTEIHYPWRQKNGDIVYNVINLNEYEKNND